MRDLAIRITQTNLTTLLISACTIIFLVIGKELVSPAINKKVKLRFPIPHELLAMIIMTIFSAVYTWRTTFAVMTVGDIPAG